MKIEQLTVTARREALPKFYGKIVIIIVADKKLQVLLVCLTGLKAISAAVWFVVLLLTIFVYCLNTTPGHVSKTVHGYVYWPYSVYSSNYLAHARTVDTRPLFRGGVWPGDEARSEVEIKAIR